MTHSKFQSLRSYRLHIEPVDFRIILCSSADLQNFLISIGNII